MNRIATYCIIALVALLPARLWAGSANSEDNTFPTEDITQFAKSVERYAAEHGARAFIIARVGRPPEELPKGIEFTHTAIAVYSTIEAQDGTPHKGYAIYNLYQKDPQVDQSELVQDYPVDFFWSAKELKAGVLIPTPQMQQNLINLIASNDYEQLHHPEYSVISNPFDARYQNCTEFTLDVINSVIYQTTDRDRLKRNARAHFAPQRVHESRLKMILGGLLLKDVSTDDHKGPVAIATFHSIARYLSSNNLVKKVSVLTPADF